MKRYKLVEDNDEWEAFIKQLEKENRIFTIIVWSIFIIFFSIIILGELIK